MRSAGAAPPWRQPPQGPLVPAGGGGPGAVLSDNPKGAVCGDGSGGCCGTAEIPINSGLVELYGREHIPAKLEGNCGRQRNSGVLLNQRCRTSWIPVQPPVQEFPAREGCW